MRAALLLSFALTAPLATAHADCPPTEGVVALAETFGADGAVLVFGDTHAVAEILTNKPTFVTSDARGVIQTEIIAQFGPMQAIFRPKGGVPVGATVSLDVGVAKGRWTVGVASVVPPTLLAVRRVHEQLPPNPGSKPAWRRWTLKVDGDARWLLVTGPGGGAGIFPVEADRRVFVEWGQCMRARHSLPHRPGIYSAQAMRTNGAPYGPKVTFTIPKAP